MTTRRYDAADYQAIYGSHLGRGKIRLLEVSPSSSATATVHGVLKSYELHQSDFVAVSYVWGDESGLIPIRLNGAQFRTTQNAHHILKMLSGVSAMDYAGDSQLNIFANSKIWIDAISIDQANRAEKEDQVASMREIYKASKRTLIWLGAPEVETFKSRAAMVWFKDLVDSMPMQRFVEGPDVGRHLWNDLAYSSTCDMMRSTWFRRRWVVQEAALSPDPLVVYGSQVLPWKVFNEAVERIGWLFTYQGNKPNLQFQPPTETFNPVTVWAVNRLRKVGIGVHSDLRFIDVLSDFRECDTSNPLDRIYALLGLCKEEERVSNRPDYKLPIADALIRLAVSHIRINNDLDILCIATQAGRIERPAVPYWHGHVKVTRAPPHCPQGIFLPNLPTWVPNLTSYYSFWSLGRDADTNIDENFISVFNASLGFPPEIYNLDTLEQSRTLAVSGIEIDEIVDIQKNTPVPFPDYQQSNMPVFENMWAFAQQHWKPQRSYPTSQALLTAYFRTISAGGRRNGSRDFLTDAFLRYYCLTFFSPAPLGQMLIARCGNAPKPPLHEQYAEPSAGAKYNDNSTVLFDKLGRHCFACTKNGRMALVSALTQPGDRIFVLYGCTSPIVLRESPERRGYYQTNGEAYIDGYMFGEAIQDEMNGLLTKKIIYLE